MSKTYVGKTLTVKAGARVRRDGALRVRKTPAIVTVRSQEPARDGKVRVSWKSHGLIATTLIKR